MWLAATMTPPADGTRWRPSTATGEAVVDRRGDGLDDAIEVLRVVRRGQPARRAARRRRGSLPPRHGRDVTPTRRHDERWSVRSSIDGEHGHGRVVVAEQDGAGEGLGAELGRGRRRAAWSRAPPAWRSNGSASWTASSSSRLPTAMPTSVRPRSSISGAAVGEQAPGRRRGSAPSRPSAPASVCERVARVKSSKRRRSTTVRPTRSAARMRRVTRSTRPTSEASSSAAVRRRRPRARWEPIERRRGRACNGRGSRLWAEGVQVAPACPPSIATSAPSPSAGHLADRVDAAGVELGGGHGADAPQPLDRQRVQERRARRRAARRSSPSGLATPLATLARNLVRATPTVMASPTRSRTSRAQPGGDLDGRAGDAAQAADVEEGLVDGDALDERRGVVEHARTRPCWPRCRPSKRGGTTTASRAQPRAWRPPMAVRTP